MPLGCLTGNGRASAVEGCYTYQRRGLKEELFPDLIEEKAVKDGFIPFSEGSLTDGDESSTVGWRGSTLGEIGVDIAVDLKRPYFIDRVVILQEVRRRDNRVTSALNGVWVYARRSVRDGYRLVGRVEASLRGKPITEERISVSVGLEASALIIRLDSFNRDLVLKELEVWGSSPEEPRLFPIPQKMEIDPKGEPFRLAEMREVIIGREPSEDTLFAAELLVEKLLEDFGVEVAVVKEHEAKLCGVVVALGKPGECGLIDSEPNLRVDKSEGYALKIEKERTLLAALDRRGLIYGVEAFLQLLWLSGDVPAVEACIIEDYPRMAIRGVHFGIPPREEIPFIKRMIRYLLAPMRMNTIFLQVTAGMKFDRRPEINEAWERANRKAALGEAPPVPHGDMISGGSYLTKEEVRDLVEYARKYGFEVIPEIQSLSHVQYLTITYPEIAEAAEGEGRRFYPDCYCPLHPESHKIVFDMIDEVVEVFKPLRFVHMGHDEAYTMAVCERCKGRSRAELYAEDVNKIYRYLKSKGLGMMVWADMLQPFLWYSAPDAIDMVPKDIVMLDFVWYFRLDEDIEDRLLSHGFKVIMGNFYSSHYPRYTARSAKPGVLGAEVSTWCRTDEYTLASKGKLYDFMYSANMIWTNHYSDELRWTMDRMIRRLIPRIRSKLGGRVYPSQAKEREFTVIDLSGSYTSSLVDATGGKGGFDLSTMPKGEAHLGGVPFKLGEGLVIVEGESVKDKRYPSKVTVPVNAKLDSLVFLHTCSMKSVRQKVIGRYTVVYEDDSTVDVEAEYGWNIAEWNRRYADPLIHTVHRHAGYIATYTADPLWQGKTATGQDVTFYGYEWINPHSEKTIRAVKVSAGEDTDSALILVAVTGVRRRNST